MRKLKLLLAVCALFGVSATSWGEVAFTYQKYLIKNVGSGMYWGASNSWGTQGSLVPSAAYLKLVPQEDGTYYIESQVSNGGTSYYFNGSYMDNDSPIKLTISEVSTGVYTIANGETFYGYNGTNTVLGNLTDGTSDNAKWTIVSLEDAKAALSDATADSPMDATFLIEDHNFGRNNRYNNRWNVTSGGGDAKKAGDNENMNWQQWNATCDINQTIASLPNGIYTLKAQGFYRPGGNDTESTAQNASLYAGTKSIGIALVSSTHSKEADAANGLTTKNTNEGSEYYVPNSQSDASKAFTAGLYENELTDIIVTDGTLTLGAKNEGTVGNQWLVIDNFRLTYYGPLDLSTYEQALEDAIAAAEAINQSDKMSTDALSGLQDAISTYKGQTYSSEEGYNAAIDAVKNAINAANTSINSYKIIAAGSIPDNSLNGWVCETFVEGQDVRFQVNTWSGEGNSDGSNMKTPFIENWTPKGNYLGVGKVYYKLEGLNPGESYYAQALVRSYNEANSDAPNGPNFFINDTEVDLTTAGTTFTYNGMSGIYATLGDQATVGEDGTLTLGITVAEDRNYNWVAFKSVSIRSMSDALAQAVANAEALEGKIPESAYSELNGVVNSHSSATVDNINAINAAVEEYAALVAPYADFKTLKAIADDLVSAGTDNTSGQSDLSDEISTQSSNVESAETADDINTAYNALKEEMTDYAINSNPVGEGQKFNMTFMLTNPDLTGLPTWQKADGWYTEQSGGNSQVMTNGNATSSDGTKTAFFEYWNNPPVGNDLFALYLTVTLPAGTYNMSCYAFAQYEQQGRHDNIPNGVYFYANDVQGSAVNNARLSEQSIEFVNDAEQEVKIGLKPVEGNGNTWMGIGYVQLFKVPANTIELDEEVAYEPESKAGTVTLKKTILSGWNTVVLPFGVAVEDIADQFGEGTLYKYTGDDEEGILNFEEETNGIQPHTPYLFNSTGTPESEMTFTGVTISTGTPATAGTNFDFVGTYEPITSITANDYVLGESAFVKAKGGNSLRAFRAYIQGKEESEARELKISIDGVLTAIKTIDGKNVSNGAIYNLAGQKVKKAQKGVFIQNGKKILK